MTGDSRLVSVNPIRDTVFASNPDLYYLIGNVLTIAASLILTGGMAANAAVSAGTSIGRAVVTEYAKQGLTMAASSYVEKSMTEATNSPLAGFVVGSLTGMATYGMLNEADLEVMNLEASLELEKQQLGNVGESGSKADVLAQNRTNGRAFEQQEFAKFSSQNNNAVEQITVKTSSGVKTRVDAIGLDANGNVVINEYKSSLTAPLTSNQKIAFPEIFESGATVVGKGKGIFSGGYQIPPGTKVTIIRPE